MVSASTMAMALGETFLTEGRAMDLAEPEAMARAREEHSRLQGVVSSLNQKISQVLAKQEGDFLAAYRAHMYTVQKELQNLRHRVVEAENVLQKNDKVQKLEDECDWYRREALRLDSFSTAMKKDLKYLKGKVEMLEQDRNWLARQLKACKKQDKMLRAELELKAEAEAEAEAETEAEAAEKQRFTADLSNGRIPGARSSQSQPVLSGIVGILEGIRRNPCCKRSRIPSPVSSATTILRRLAEGPLQDEDAAHLQRAATGAAAATDGGAAARAALRCPEVEDVFIRCLKNPRRNIVRPKRQGHASYVYAAGRRPGTRAHGCHPQGGGKLNELGSLSVSQSMESNTTMLETSASASSRQPPLTKRELLQPTISINFTTADRRAVLESLLQRDEVVAQLFHVLFPTREIRPENTANGHADFGPHQSLTVGNGNKTSSRPVTTA